MRCAYAYDQKIASNEASLVTPPDDDYAVQDSKEECDINTIVRRFGLTGQLPVAAIPPQYTDYEQVFDYHTAMNTILEAEKTFSSLPWDVRKRFDHNPNQLLEFISNESNRKEAVALGFIFETPESSGVAANNSGETAA